MKCLKTNLRIQPYYKLMRHFFCFFNLLLILLLVEPELFSQTNKKRSFGALLLSKEEYSKLPRTNWDTLRKYSNIKSIEDSAKSIITLTSPPIGNQGNQASCVGWSVGYSALSILAHPKYDCWDIASRSPSYIFNQINYGCLVGSYMTDALDLVVDEGSCSIALMPYNDNNCTTQPDGTQVLEASKHDATNYYAVYPNTDVEEIKGAIDLGYPVPCAFDVYESFMDIWFDDGIWDTANSGENLGSHAVCIVGYDDVSEMFKVQNSWGTDDGDQGFFWVTFDLVESGCINELYILYGMNASYPESISGSSLVCTNGTTFTLNYPPPSCNYTWDCSENMTLSSSWDNYALFTANSGASGEGYIQVSVDECTFNIPQKNVWVGVPQPTITGEEYPGCGDINWYFLDPDDMWGTYLWSVTYNLSVLGSSLGHKAQIIANQEGTSTIYCDVTNTCGTNHGSLQVFVGECFNFIIIPNPTHDYINIQIDETTTDFNELDSYEINIINIQNKVVLQQRTSNLITKLSVKDLFPGIYFVQIVFKGKFYTKQFIIN